MFQTNVLCSDSVVAQVMDTSYEIPEFTNSISESKARNPHVNIGNSNDQMRVMYITVTYIIMVIIITGNLLKIYHRW